MTDASDAQERRLDRTVTVAATGSVEARPDIAHVSTGVVTEAAAAKAALEANSKATRAVIDGLKALGIGAKDIQTAQISIHPQHESNRTGGTPRIVSYRAVNRVEIVARDIARLGEVLDRSVELGANQLLGIRFEVSNAETLLDEARKQAMANARRRAELYATAAQAQLGEVLSITEAGAVQGPRPLQYGRAAMAEAVPIEAGSERLEMRLNVTWSLK